MSRNISMAATIQQINARSKTVTRRKGWLFLKSGTELCAVEKGQGIPKGEKIKRLTRIKVVSVRREKLEMIKASGECALEGFPDMSPSEFIDMFCRINPGMTSQSVVTRIEFEYVEEQ